MIRDAALVYRYTQTPQGKMIVVADDSGVRLLEFCDGDGLGQARDHFRRTGVPSELVPGDHPHIAILVSQLSEYFAGERRQFSVPLEADGTEFQRRVWEYLTTIPFARTRTYGQQARALGDPAAVRAVGRANGANPIAVVVPCHRVIGAAGDLTGYAGGLDRKRWLLEHERHLAGGSLFEPAQAPLRRRADKSLAFS